MTPRLENLSWLIDWAAREGAPDPLLRRASAELVDLVESVNPQKLAALRNARRIRAAYENGCTGVPALVERFRVSRATVFRALREHHALDTPSRYNGRQPPKEAAVDLKNSSIGLGSMPAPRSTLHVKPAPPADTTPRDNGGMSTGTTSGNFSLGGMTQVPNNAGATGTESGAEAAHAAMTENGK